MAMNTLDELKYYCNEKAPAGALMLIGEWGCGKTYMVDHMLAEALRDSHIFIRISLFGIDSMDAVSNTVTQAWINAALEEKGKVGAWMKKAIHAKQAIAEVAESVNGTAGAVLSLDICQFASVSNTIGGKTVVLVFDDLERCRIDPVDLLGAINEYCENQRFHTIIIANEDYMLKQEETLPIQGKDAQAHAREEQGTDHGRIPGARPLRYKEIKEKIVQRTVRISPDYSNIIGSVIESYATDDAEYKKFLKSHAEQLRNLFDVGIPMTEADFMQSGIAGETIKKNYEVHTPHNIRSFRCAIQDFHRVFVLLTRHGVMEELNEWLYAFVMFTMAHRAGTVTDSARYGDLFTDIGVSQLYPSYYKDKYILGFEKTWVLHGTWDEEIAESQIERLKERQQAATPYDIVRTCQLEYIDEDVFNAGFPLVLEEAYCGGLTIDDYIQFIRNTASARTHQLELPVSVDWDRVRAGIQGKLDSMLQQGQEDVRFRHFISDNNLELLTEEERSAYSLIDDFRNGEKLMYAKSRKEFLELMETDHDLVFSKLRNAPFDCFDKEMADSVAEAFVRCSNSDRASLPTDFEQMWRRNIQSPNIDREKTLEGFRHLLEKLLEAKNNVDKTKTITLFHYSRFSDLIKELIAQTQAEGTDTRDV